MWRHSYYDEDLDLSWHVDDEDYDDLYDVAIYYDKDGSDFPQIVERGSKAELIAFFEIEKNKLLSVNSPVVLNREEERNVTFLLHLAVSVPLESYHPDFVEYIIHSQRININKMNTAGYAPLHYAVLRSNTAAAQALIEAGADVNLQDSNQLRYTEWDISRIGSESFPLHMAVKDQELERRPFPSDFETDSHFGPQNLDLIKLLLSSGANCNVLDGQGLAPLHYAVWADDVSAADILLEAGADINIQSFSEKVTPLFCVESQTMLLFLLSKEADQSLPDGYGETVLSHFISLSLHKLSLTLLSDSSENDFCNKRDLLGSAFKNRDETAVKILINSGCVPRSEVYMYKLHIDPRYRTIPNYKNIIEAMDQIASNPSKLFDLCSIKIRNVLKTNIRVAVLDLELPEELRGAICLKDLDFAQDPNLAGDCV